GVAVQANLPVRRLGALLRARGPGHRGGRWFLEGRSGRWRDRAGLPTWGRTRPGRQDTDVFRQRSVRGSRDEKRADPRVRGQAILVDEERRAHLWGVRARATRAESGGGARRLTAPLASILIPTFNAEERMWGAI